MWNTSNLEIAVHEPVAPGQREVVASWGWPSEFSSWTWDSAAPPGTNFSINVYTSYPTAGLELNGKPLGGTVETKNLVASFAAAYAPGTLTAVGYDEAGKVAEKKTLTSAGAATSIRLTADRSSIKATRSDLSFVTAEVVDANGTFHHPYICHSQVAKKDLRLPIAYDS